MSISASFFYKTTLAITVSTVFLSTILHLFKVLRINYDLGGYLFYITFPLLVILYLINSIIKAQKKIHRIEIAFILYFLLVLTITFTITIYNKGDPVDIVGNMLRLLLPIFMIFAILGNSLATIQYISNNIIRLSKTALIIALTSASVLHIYSFNGGSVYFGLQPTIAFISLAYGLSNKNHIYTILSIIAIILSGKRGGMLALAIIVIVHFVILAMQGKLTKILKALAFLLFLIFLTTQFNLIPENILNRINWIYEIFSGEVVDLNRASAGRVDEIESFLSKISNNTHAWIFGYGLGATIDIGETSDSTIHFSPFGLILIMGLPLTIILYLFISGLIIFSIKKIINLRNKNLSKLLHITILLLAGEIAFSMTAFTILQSYTLWFCISLIIIILTYSKKIERHYNT